MQIVPSTAIVLVLLAIMVASGPRRAMFILFSFLPFGMMAAFNLPAVGGTSIIGVDLAVVTLTLLLLTYRNGLNHLLSAFAPGTPGFLLFLFLGYSIFATAFFPRVFAGLEVFSLGRSGNEDGIIVQPLRPGNGNLSQLMRMILSIMAYAAVMVLVRRLRDAEQVLACVKLVTIVHVGMGVIDILTNAANLTFLLEPIRTANYSLTLGQKTAGLNRMIGGFPEASSYGYLSLGLFGFWLSFWVTHKTRARTGAIFLALMTFAVLRGTSSAAYVATMMLCVVFATSRVFAITGGVVRVRNAAILVTTLAMLPLAVAGLYSIYELVPAFAGFIDRALLDKLATESGIERMSWNAQALRNAADTYFLGAGLGSVRASNWLFSTLASTGAIGTALSIAFLYRVFRTPTHGLDERDRQIILALKVGCAGFLMSALVVKTSPNLEISFFVLAGLVVGLAAKQTSVDIKQPKAEQSMP